MFGNREHVARADTITSMASRTSTELGHPPCEALTFTAVAAALSDPVRLAIVRRLARLPRGGEMPCTAFDLPVSKSTQSGHFKVLRQAGVIRQRDVGTRRLNSLRRDDLEARFPGLLELAIVNGSRGEAAARRGTAVADYPAGGLSAGGSPADGGAPGGSGAAPCSGAAPAPGAPAVG
jgi:DNA-binding transcriptional ArsR family regulator